MILEELTTNYLLEFINNVYPRRDELTDTLEDNQKIDLTSSLSWEHNDGCLVYIETYKNGIIERPIGSFTDRQTYYNKCENDNCSITKYTYVNLTTGKVEKIKFDVNTYSNHYDSDYEYKVNYSVEIELDNDIYDYLSFCTNSVAKYENDIAKILEEINK